ncbi:MAG: hypothetical protein BWK73_20125 [Thiothrix lacustris]|uniref:Uncharacterized protein n=1 Tax=Thiothrix lacustris TaxID=525917 RepID=A0A1Y1QPE2_9GAMM|nr:MAG: hypothetical protein BWK73_20125 [Thiothrix lacustris]
MSQPDLQAIMEAAIAKHLAPFLAAQTKPQEPELDIELDYPQVKVYLDHKLDKMIKQLQADYDAKLANIQPSSINKLLPSLVPGIADVTPEFDATPMMPGIPVTWGDARKAAEKLGDVDALKKYTASFAAYKAQAAGSSEPPSSPSRTTNPTESAQAPVSDRDQDLAAFMAGRIKREDYQAKYGVH